MLSKIGLHHVVILLICPTLLYLLFRVLMKGKSLKKRVTMKDMKWKCIVGTIRYVFVLLYAMLILSRDKVVSRSRVLSFIQLLNLTGWGGSKKSVSFLIESVTIQGPHWITFNLLISLSLCKNCTGLEFYILMFCWKNSSYFSCLVSVMGSIFLF